MIAYTAYQIVDCVGTLVCYTTNHRHVRKAGEGRRDERMEFAMNIAAWAVEAPAAMQLLSLDALLLGACAPGVSASL